MEETIISQKQALKYLWVRIKKYKFYITGSLAFAFIYVILSLYVPKLIGHGTDKIIGKGKVEFEGIAEIGVEILICTLIAAACWWIMGAINNKITYNVIRDVRQEAFEKLQKLPLKYIDSSSNGEIVSKIIADVDQLADGLLMGFSQLFTGIVTIIFTLVFMLTIHWKISLVVVLVTPLSLFVAAFIAKHTFRLFKILSEIRGEQTTLTDEMIGGEKIVKAFGQEEHAIEKFDEVNDKLGKYFVSATFFSSITNPATRFVNNIVYALVAISGSLTSIMTGGITVGGLVCILSYANQYTKPFNEISGVITELQNAVACGSRVFSLIYREEESETGLEDELKSIKGKVDIEDVYFSYDKNKELIKDFNLHVKQGQRIAIVGPTGCGKTTIINLLMRFYKVDKGSIKVDGKNINDVTKKSLRNGYGMVLQETWLKNASIKENITMANKDASMKEIVEAAKAAHAHSFIKRLPNGYDTILDESGDNLSQGQKQLLCITRVMLSNPSVLILDEATSSIDTRTEIKIQKAFGKMMEGRTSFIVAHRLSTIKEADLILVMKDGRIVEQGKHEELLEKQGFYNNLYNSQFAN